MEFKTKLKRTTESGSASIVVDTIHFSGQVDVTDPCYNKDVWCRINNLEVEEGDYDCVVILNDEGRWGKRIKKSGIYLNGVCPKEHDMEYIGYIGVDAGLAGFFMNKSDYSDEEWSQICEECDEGCAWITDEGFFSESGYGDGGYHVSGHYNDNGVLDALEIVFID